MNKDRILELAREAGICPDTDAFTPWPEQLDGWRKFATLIEREVRGDDEPVLWLYDFFVDGEEFCNWSTESLEEVEVCHNVRPLYLHPAPLPIAEPLLYQYRMKPLFDDKFPWSYWQECSKEVYLQYKKQPVWDDYTYESRVLYSQPTTEITDQLMSIIDLYEKALLTTFPQGASDEVFEYWNKARKALNKITG